VQIKIWQPCTKKPSPQSECFGGRFFFLFNAADWREPETAFIQLEVNEEIDYKSNPISAAEAGSPSCTVATEASKKRRWSMLVFSV
jgi:hypothetical protein